MFMNIHQRSSLDELYLTGLSVQRGPPLFVLSVKIVIGKVGCFSLKYVRCRFHANKVDIVSYYFVFHFDNKILYSDVSCHTVYIL